MFAIRIQLWLDPSAHGSLTAGDLVEAMAEAFPADCRVEHLTCRTHASERLIDAIAFVRAPSLAAAESAVRRALLAGIAARSAFRGWELTRCEADFMLTQGLLWRD